ncbi:MAG TPA: ATP-binding protein [Bacillota bacterium]|nr:ATP-binding protein [Bacillota bacterium]
MRLITKINIYFAIILAVLMVAVFNFTQHFFQKELEAQMEDSLQITFESFKIAVTNLLDEQEGKALAHSKRDVIGIAAKDRINSVLNYYLNLAAQDYNINLMEVLDPRGQLLADNRQSYDASQIRQVVFKNPAPATCTSYLTQRGNRIYLVTTTPIFYANQVVGFLNLGTQVNQKLIDYFTSILHSEILFFADSRQTVGAVRFKGIPEDLLGQLKNEPVLPVFLPGSRAGVTDYDFVLSTLPSDGGFTGIVAIAKSRAGIQTGLLRLQLFLTLLTGVSLLFGIIGTHSLARNIKKSIFGMEPQEIAALLNQRTAILQSTFEGIIALDETGRIILINKEANRFLPADCAVIGQPAVNFFSDLKIQEVLETGLAIYNQQQVMGESVIVYNCIPIKTKSRIAGAVITLRDLTEFQRVAAELMEVKNYTQALRAQSHEFMNKMQSVSGLIQLGRYETALTLLHETTESHQEMVSYLANAFSNSAVSGILLGKFNRAKELNIHFEIDRTSYIPRDAHVPDHELVCIVGNLIENAFESLQMAHQSPKTVIARLRPVNQYLQILIIDNGPGIPVAIRQVIFNRGFTSKKGQNKGIGLSLVKQYVENLRGSIRFHSNSKFTVFWVKIPLR